MVPPAYKPTRLETLKRLVPVQELCGICSRLQQASMPTRSRSPTPSSIRTPTNNQRQAGAHRVDRRPKTRGSWSVTGCGHCAPIFVDSTLTNCSHLTRYVPAVPNACSTVLSSFVSHSDFWCASGRPFPEPHHAHAARPERTVTSPVTALHRPCVRTPCPHPGSLASARMWCAV
jgi:hypothetical protein